MVNGNGDGKGCESLTEFANCVNRRKLQRLGQTEAEGLQLEAQENISPRKREQEQEQPQEVHITVYILYAIFI